MWKTIMITLHGGQNKSVPFFFVVVSKSFSLLLLFVLSRYLAVSMFATL